MTRGSYVSLVIIIMAKVDLSEHLYNILYPETAENVMHK